VLLLDFALLVVGVVNAKKAIVERIVHATIMLFFILFFARLYPIALIGFKLFFDLVFITLLF